MRSPGLLSGCKVSRLFVTFFSCTFPCERGLILLAFFVRKLVGFPFPSRSSETARFLMEMHVARRFDPYAENGGCVYRLDQVRVEIGQDQYT